MILPSLSQLSENSGRAICRTGKKWRTEEPRKFRGHTFETFFICGVLCDGDSTSSLTREPSALTLLANDSQRLCMRADCQRRWWLACNRRPLQMHSLQVGCHGKPIIHLNTKPERCMWLKLMLFLRLLKLSLPDFFPPPLPPSGVLVLHASMERFERIFSSARTLTLMSKHLLLVHFPLASPRVFLRTEKKRACRRY